MGRAARPAASGSPLQLLRRTACPIPQLIVIAGGVGTVKQLRLMLRQALQEQTVLCAGLEQQASRLKSRAPRVAVDAVFAARLRKILRMCGPGRGLSSRCLHPLRGARPLPLRA